MTDVNNGSFDNIGKTGNKGSDNINFGKILSIKAERKDDAIEFLIYNDLGDWHRDTIGLTEPSKRITNVTVEFEYEGVKVKAKLEGDVINDIEKSELCLTGKLKFKILGQEIVIDLDKDCDGY
ncbi:hypothetical protein [Lysinibacillus sphaericus]|uniref:Uncharacterized protein n=1 Tax=Lysinibacillus sphaericus OT4b.31 TaxID=1285586 RepID=R7ZJ51_LYSSH|nr:hypothetical protein [Lysinibacillus sphaericus]EON74120.1 hypothetical protein H131_01523 [Lysinibacillus sphaericus OT4b.31]